MTSKTGLFLLLICALGLALRLLSLNSGINLDDATTLFVAQATDFSQLLDRVKDHEFGPPLYFLFMHHWIAIFGKSAASLATPSIIFGTCLIGATYLLAGSISAKPAVQKIAALFATISPLAIFFSHEARTYSLTALFSTLSLYFLIKVRQTSSKTSMIGLFVFSTLLFYSHYLGLIIMGFGLIFTFAISMYGEEKSPKENINSILVLLASGLAFAPWLPAFFEHSTHGTYWVDQTPITEWPKVFTSNLAATLPLPWLHGYLLIWLLLPILAIGTVVTMFKRKVNPVKTLAMLVKNNQIETALILSVLAASASLGYLTPFILGYSRYMLPFAVLTWIMLALLVSSCLEEASKSKKIALAAILLIVSLDCAMEIFSLTSTDKNGLREIAQDIKTGKFKNSAILVAPDFDSYSFIYYLEEEQNLPVPEAYFTYPRKRELNPSSHKGYAQTWQDKNRQVELLSQIKALDHSKFKHLIVIVDNDVLDSTKMPAKTRIEELLTLLKTTFPCPEKNLFYKTRGRSFYVYQFDLGVRD